MHFRSLLLSCFSGIAAFCLTAADIAAQPGSFTEQIEIEGVTFFRDSSDRNVFYYLPQYCRFARTADNQHLAVEIVKYVSGDPDGPRGGIVQAVLDFSLPAGRLESLQQALSQRYPGAHIAGSVPLQLRSDSREWIYHLPWLADSLKLTYTFIPPANALIRQSVDQSRATLVGAILTNNLSEQYTPPAIPFVLPGSAGPPNGQTGNTLFSGELPFLPNQPSEHFSGVRTLNTDIYQPRARVVNIFPDGYFQEEQQIPLEVSLRLRKKADRDSNYVVFEEQAPALGQWENLSLTLPETSSFSDRRAALLRYEYQISQSYSLSDNDRRRRRDSEWTDTDVGAIVLVPVVRKRTVDVVTLTDALTRRGVLAFRFEVLKKEDEGYQPLASCRIDLSERQGAEITESLPYLSDAPDETFFYRVIWFTQKGTIKGSVRRSEASIIFLDELPLD